MIVSIHHDLELMRAHYILLLFRFLRVIVAREV